MVVVRSLVQLWVLVLEPVESPSRCRARRCRRLVSDLPVLFRERSCTAVGIHCY